MSCIPWLNFNNFMPNAYCNCAMPFPMFMGYPMGCGMPSIFSSAMSMPMTMPMAMPMFNPYMNFNPFANFNFNTCFNPFQNISNFSVNPKLTKENNNVTNKENADIESNKPKGNEVPDGTKITVSGIDYSIFDNPNKIKELRPEMQRKVEQLYKYAKGKGWKIRLTSGFRSIEKQTQMYNAWKAGKYNAPAVAKPGSSRHNYGCAVDLKINGKSSGAELLELGKYAKTIGVRQGLSFHEAWHFDLDPKTTPKGTTQA